MKREFSKVTGSLWILVLAAAICLLPSGVFASNAGSSGTISGDANVTVGTANCSTGGSFSGATGVLVLDENGSTGVTGTNATVLCTLPTVNSGTVQIFDPAKYGGEVSDILDFVPNSLGGTNVYLYSVNDFGFTQSDANTFALSLNNVAITEFNLNGSSGLTVYDSGNSGVNNGYGSCMYSQPDGSHYELDNCANNGYIINSNTDESAPEASSIALLGTLLVMGLAFGRRVLG